MEKGGIFFHFPAAVFFLSAAVFGGRTGGG
jgi:hypothetical protein